MVWQIEVGVGDRFYMIIYDGIIFDLQKTGGISILFEEIFHRLLSNGVEHRVLKYRNRSEARDVILRKRTLERYRDVCVPLQGEIFHSTYYRLPSMGSKNMAVFTTVHDFTYERHVGGVRAKVHSWQKNRAINKSDKIICVSESTKQDALEFSGVSEDRISVVYNGVSNDYYPLNKIDLNSFMYVLFVGARAGYKNFEVAVKAVSLHRDIHLVCVGGGAFAEEELVFLESHLSGRYSHAGFVTNQELNVFYNEAFCLLYPSIYEGFGIPILEAMSAGCPVIAVNASSIPEVAGDSALLIERGTVDEIDTAISSLYCSDRRAGLIAKGLAQAKKFSWDSTYVRTLALYEGVLGKKLA